MNPVYVVHKVTLAYERVQVFRKLDLTIYAGETTLLIGANGTGKSSLLRLLAGLITPQKGTVSRPSTPIGFVGHQSMLYTELSVKTNLTLFSSLIGCSLHQQTDCIQALRLESLLERRVDTLSQGQKLRVSLCRALLGSPSGLVLDEPTSALDASAVKELLSLLEEFRRADPRRFIVFSSHDLSRVKHIADRVLLLDDKVVWGDSHRLGKDEVLRSYEEHNR
jgi:ABC-type multidrug transport system ATPase subunit